MRQEDKEVDDFELEQAEERKRENELIEEDEEELYDLDGKPEIEVDQARSGSIVGALRTILEREQLVINDLKLPQRELRALEAVRTAVEGRDNKLEFVFAEDRRTLLEQALAVLQPEIQSIAELGQPFDELMREVSDLREKLNTLEDSQEELVEGRFKDAAKTETDSDDKPEPDEDQSLTGPERKIDKPKTSLTGAERKAEPKPETSLTGAERKVEKAKTSLSGPERKEEPKPETTLTGAERKPETKAQTSLGDAKDIAAAEKKLPSWRRGG